MGRHSILTDPAPDVVVETIYGNFQMFGSAQNEVTAQFAGENNGKLAKEEGVVQLHAMGECLVRVPESARVSLESVYGNARVKSLLGELNVGRVLGSLVVRDVAGTTIGSVYGELSVQMVDEALHVGQVLGNASLKEVQGNCKLDRIAGNLDLRNIAGDLSAYVGGNANIRLGRLPGMHYKVNAGGNIFFTILEEASAQVTITSGANEILINLPEGNEIHHENSYIFTIGDGDATIELSAGGKISFSTGGASQSLNADDRWVEVGEVFSGFSEEFNGQIEEQIEAQMRILDEQMERLSTAMTGAGLPPEEANQILERARRTSESASERAQKKMDRVRSELERKLAAAERKVEIKMKAVERRQAQMGKHDWRIEWASSAPARKEDPVSEEERLVILRMLEQKKISLAEAEKLLEALEGKS